MSATPPIDNNYLQARLAALGITAEINKHIILTESKNTKGQVIEEVHPFFTADTEGNIEIHYYNLTGQPYSWRKEDTKWPRNYVRTRLRTPGIYKGNALPNAGQKYFQDKGSGQFPFFPPRILKKYKACKEGVLPDGKSAPEPIVTLVITEGEFKSFKGDMAGLDIIGIPSIHGFYNGDVRGKLHEDIQEVIVTCQVKNIIFLVDADLLTLKWEANKDLAKRAESFYSSVKLFRESLQLLFDNEKIPLNHIAVMHLKTNFVNEAKGLDDLLVKYSSVHEEIKKDLLEFQFAQKYFSGKLINDPNKDLANFRRYLGLYDEQEFYRCYGEFIGSREFLYKNKRYEYNADKKEVQFVRHEDADKYMRIGPDWIKIIKKKNAYGEIEEEMKPWSIAEINRDYRVGKNSDFFINQLLRFDDFCNEPAWNGDYKRVHDGCYNLVSPLRWDYIPGSISHTYKFLKHIFQGAATIELDDDGKIVKEIPILADQFTVILDWLSIILRNPKHMLPVPILVSKENGTGKSTFLKWLNVIFGSNMCILGNDQFKMKFNGHYITKYIISIDEGFLDVDKKAEKERLKQLVTANVAFLENKGMNVTKIAYYSKVIICSNDADRVMKIDEGESRWFVVKVPVIPMKKLTGKQMLELGYRTFSGKAIEEDKVYEVPDVNPDLEVLMKKEIPAFIHFLRERQIFHPRVNRLWFDPEWFITEQFKVIVDQTKNRVDRVFEDWISEQFLLYRLPVLRYPLNYLTEIFNDPKNSKYRIDNIELKAYLVERKGLKPENTQRVKIPTGFAMNDVRLGIEINYKDATARPLVFVAEKWLNEENLAEFRKPQKLVAEGTSDKVVQGELLPAGGSDDLPF
jgi:hypothetical protein